MCFALRTTLLEGYKYVATTSLHEGEKGKKVEKGKCRVNKNVWPPHVCVSYHLVKIFMRQEKHHGDETYKQERLTFLCRKHVKMLKRPTHKKAPCFYYSFTL